MKKNFVFMAFAKGNVSTESVAPKRYVGVAPVKVIGVNPNKSQTNDLMGYEPENEPVYVVEADGVKSARVDFIIKTVEEKCGVDLTTRLTFWVRNQARYNKDNTKVQVIDKYGRTAWATAEECKNHSTMLTKNDGTKYQANIDSDYRPCFVGEEALTNFVKTYLNISNPMSYVNGAWVPNTKVNPADCEARFEDVAKFFEGNFAELSEMIAYQPDNKVKVLFGVRTTDEGKQYQSVYTDMVLKPSVTDYSKLDAEVKSRKDAGAYPTTEFKICDIEEYSVEPTTFNAAPAAAPTDWGFTA